MAAGSNAVRAFIFERGNDVYVVYWHISGSSHLKLVLLRSKVQLFETLGVEEAIDSGANGSIVIPASNRRFLKVENLTKEQILDAFNKAKVIN